MFEYKTLHVGRRDLTGKGKGKVGAYAVTARSCGAHLRPISPLSLWWVRTR